MRDDEKDYYRILEIQPDASLEVMNNAYRALVRKYHPDVYHTHQKDRMNTHMQRINEAYQTLSNPITRAEYDRRYRPAPVSLPARRRLAPGRMLLWGLGAYLALKLLLFPATPLLRGVLLVLLLALVIRARRKARS